MKKLTPTPSELEILQIIWEHGASTVKFIHSNIKREKEVGYTSVLKIMQLMTEKGLLSREVSGKAHIYSAILQEEETQEALLDRFLDKTFRGSASKLIIKALGNKKTSKAELDQIKDFIDNINKE